MNAAALSFEELISTESSSELATARSMTVSTPASRNFFAVVGPIPGISCISKSSIIVGTGFDSKSLSEISGLSLERALTTSSSFILSLFLFFIFLKNQKFITFEILKGISNTQQIIVVENIAYCFIFDGQDNSIDL